MHRTTMQGFHIAQYIIIAFCNTCNEKSISTFHIKGRVGRKSTLFLLSVFVKAFRIVIFYNSSSEK